MIAFDLLLATLLLAVSVSAQCNTSFPGKEINYISSNPSSQFVYYLGNHQRSATECKDACHDINYMCDAWQKQHDSYMEAGSKWEHDTDQCAVSISDNGEGYDGSYVLLTPDLAADEYVIELNLRVTAVGSTIQGVGGGLLFSASGTGADASFVSINPDFDPGYMTCGKLRPERAQFGFSPITTRSLSLDTDYTIRVHKNSQSGSNVDFYLDGVEPNNLLCDVPSDSPNFVGVYAWDCDVTFTSLKVSFPNSAERTVCSAYQFNTATSECFGYYGTDYAALYDAMTSNANFDSGIMSPTCQPTTAPATNATPTSATLTTQSPVAPDPTTGIISPTSRPTTAPSIAPSISVTLSRTTTSPPLTTAVRNYTHYTVTIESDDVNLNATKIFLIVSHVAFNLSSSPLIVRSKNDHGATEVVIAFPSDAKLSTDVIEETIREAMVDEYSGAQVDVTVEKDETVNAQADKELKNKFSDGLLIALVVFFVLFVAFLVVYVWKTRRSDAKGAVPEPYQIGMVQRSNRVSSKQPGQAPHMVRVNSAERADVFVGDEDEPQLQASPGRAVSSNALGDNDDQHENEDVVGATPDGVTAGGNTENIANLEDGEFVVEEDGEGSEKETTKGNSQ